MKKQVNNMFLFLDDYSVSDDFNKLSIENEIRRGSWPKIVHQGPNVNIKVPRRSFDTHEERMFFTKQITLKQKTEVI